MDKYKIIKLFPVSNRDKTEQSTTIQCLDLSTIVLFCQICCAKVYLQIQSYPQFSFMLSKMDIKEGEVFVQKCHAETGGHAESSETELSLTSVQVHNNIFYETKIRAILTIKCQLIVKYFCV